ncbi:hypothetical protein [Achromobacter piechaudii]|uniref:Uncharacterized protein n=1 Tax=Achromobacter piechaudii TaxID=72556 RepID=A0ABM8L2S6_9BURK|nr:hypothetical protein [Achromobacter piechaudii]CAB3728899.1 hypothetical protein LMG1873_04624 [Achromobacter piechaudii]CAB3905199.1 hypothetical protein LMG2828_04711 [Achromobacter piechaudii]
MTELTHEQRLAMDRANRAEAITQDPLVLAALAQLEEDIFEVWKDPKLNAEQREELHRMHKTLGRFVGVFDAYIMGGAEPRHILGVPAPEKTFLQRIKERIHGKKA